MIEVFKDKIWKMVKGKGVSLLMLYDDSGEILWHKGIEISEDHANMESHFSRTYILQNLKNLEKLYKEDESLDFKDDMISESANFFHNIHNKCLSIIPIMDRYFLYLESSTRKYFTKEDRLSFKILCGLLGDVIELIRLRERDVKRISGSSKIIKNILELVIKYSFEEEPVLLVGETGVGKNHIAELIHHYSDRRGEFVVVHTPSFPESLFEREVFGHIKGAFTGAESSRKGLVTEAEGGTLFFDEIAEVPVTFQAKLLQLIDTKKYRVLGDSTEKKANIRIIASSNRNLREAVIEGTFRKDLYFRLNVLPIEIPPLRERKEDIPAIVKENERHLNGKKLGSGFWEEVLKYDWPGNIRELIHVIKRVGIELNNPVIGREISNIISQSCFNSNVCYRSNGIDQIWEELQSGKGFWDVVKKPFLDRELKREEVKNIISKGLIETGGKYKNLLEIFNIEEKEYKNFMRFLYDNQLK